jgi:hypothetical protein
MRTPRDVKQFDQAGPGPVERDREHGDERGRDGPERPRLASFAPAGGIDVLDRSMACVLKRLLYGCSQRIAQTRLRLAQRAKGNTHTEEIAEQRHRRATAHVIDAGQQPDECREPGTAHSPRHAIGKFGACHMSTRAADRVQPVLGHLRLHRRDLHDLVANGVDARLPGQVPLAPVARRREVVLGRGDRLRRQELAPVPLVPALTASLFPARLRLRALGARARRVGRRRLPRVHRVLGQPCLQLGHARHESLNDLSLRRDDALLLGDLLIAGVGHTRV